MAVILHVPTSDIRFESAKLLLNHAFANYQMVELLPDSALALVRVHMGSSPWVQPVLSGETRLLLEKSQVSGLRKELSLAEETEAPVAEGQTLGVLRLLDREGTELARVELRAGETVERASWGSVLLRLIRMVFLGEA